MTLFLGLLLVAVLCPPVYKFYLGDAISFTRWYPKQGKRKIDIQRYNQDWTSLDAVSLHFIYALIVAEDARFFDHPGIDMIELQDSLRLNWERKAFVRGASTITQQVVRLAFLDREKNLLRKFREVLGAVLLETFLTKEEILEWYINIVSFGVGVYGVGVAAQYFFDKEIAALTINDSIQLALVLPGPNVQSKQLLNRKLTPYGVKRFFQIAQQLRNNGYITEKQFHHSVATGDFGLPVKEL